MVPPLCYRAGMVDGPLPLLVQVSGKPGSGKSTLARALADRTALGLPLLSMDMVRRALEEPYRDSTLELDGRTGVEALYRLVDTFLVARLSLILELSFRRGLDEWRLQPLLARARVVNVHCAAPEALARTRFLAREHLLAEAGARTYPAIAQAMQAGAFDWQVFDPLDLPVPRLLVDTGTPTYAPPLAEIVAFCRA